MRQIGLDPNVQDPYNDEQWNQAVTNAVSDSNAANTAYTNQMNQIGTSMQPYFNQLDYQNQQDVGRTNMQMALNGLLGSSNMAQALGNLGTSYQNQRGGLTSQQQQLESNASATKTSTLNNIMDALRAALGTHTSLEAEKGLGGAKTQGQTQANNQFLSGVNSTPTGQLIGVNPGAASAPAPGENPQYTAQGLADRMYQDYSGNMGMAEQYPWVMQGAQNAFQQAGQSNPSLGNILAGPQFDAIRRRLGL
jgi:hypothetical protein